MQTDHKPPRLLRPDETWCPWCKSIFLTGQLFEKHRPRGVCVDIIEMGLVQDRHGAWGYPDGNQVMENRPRRSFAQVSFERLVGKLSAKTRSQEDFMMDELKVATVLERDRVECTKTQSRALAEPGKRRSSAEVAFERIVKILPRKNSETNKDIERVAGALERDRRRVTHIKKGR